MLKDEPKLLENMDSMMPVLKLISNNEFKNRYHLPVVPKSGLCCRVALMLKDEPEAVGKRGHGDARVGASLRQ